MSEIDLREFAQTLNIQITDDMTKQEICDAIRSDLTVDQIQHFDIDMRDKRLYQPLLSLDLSEDAQLFFNPTTVARMIGHQIVRPQTYGTLGAALKEVEKQMNNLVDDVRRTDMGVVYQDSNGRFHRYTNFQDWLENTPAEKLTNQEHLFEIHIDYVHMGWIKMTINKLTDLIMGKQSYVDRLNDRKRYDVVVNDKVEKTFKTFDQARRYLYDQLIQTKPYFVFSTNAFLPIDKNIIKLYTQNDDKIKSMTEWFFKNKTPLNFVIQERELQQNDDPQKQAELLKAIFQRRNAGPMQQQADQQTAQQTGRSRTNARSRQLSSKRFAPEPNPQFQQETFQ